MRARLEGGEHLSMQQVQDIATDQVKLEFAAGDLSLTDSEAAEGEAAVKGRTIDEAADMTQRYRIDATKNVEPVAVEEDVRVRIEGIGLLVHRFDLRDTKGFIRDVKTSRRKPNKDAAAKSTQATAYWLAQWARTKTPPAGVAFDYIVRTPGGATTPPKTSYDVQETTRSHVQVEAYIERLVAMKSTIEKGAFHPTNRETNPLCSPKYCSFFGRACKYTRGESRD